VDYRIDPNDSLKTTQNRIVTMFDKVPTEFPVPNSRADMSVTINPCINLSKMRTVTCTFLARMQPLLFSGVPHEQ
jgi:hypothetical protein